MAENFDTIIRGGTIVDGSGAPPFAADLGIRDGRISAIGAIGADARATREIDATGKLVTPGFVDIHTHYDGQATWSHRLAPSSSHGVTTVVMGNCGVGFAPCRPQDRDDLIRLMEGVEDIPGAVMADGLPWSWETFPEFLDFLGARQFDMDICAQLPHAPLRVYVMGDRALEREPATAADVAAMRALAKDAIAAGAIGFSTSRSINHRSSDSHLMPSVTAAEGELAEIALGVRDGGPGVLQAISDFDYPEDDFAMLRRVAGKSGLPISFTLLQQPHAPDRWRAILACLDAANADGHRMRAQIFSRPVGVLVGLRLNYNPFSFCPSYLPLADLPADERLAMLRDPELRAQLISEYPARSWVPVSGTFQDPDNIFPMADQPDYEPDRAQSVGSMAKARGVSGAKLLFDLMVADQGDAVFYIPAANFAAGNTDAVRAMIDHEHTVLGLGDGGAHVGMICDASSPTYVLKRWVTADGEGRRGLADLVRGLSAAPAATVGLLDRGLVRIGYRADLNLIDPDRLALHRPHIVHDLPSGGGRLQQDADGYVATFVNGVMTYRAGEHTGALPGRLVRGAQPEPIAA